MQFFDIRFMKYKTNHFFEIFFVPKSLCQSFNDRYLSIDALMRILVIFLYNPEINHC